VKKKIILGITLSLLLVAGLVSGVFSPAMAQDETGTTSVTITKYDTDGFTILAQHSVTWDWMAANLMPQGDGATRYYHQGPVTTGDMWNPDEDDNLDDFGPCMGTDIKDLCDLPEIGGALPGDEIEVRDSVDNFGALFAYEDVYLPEPEQGKLVLTWLNADYGTVVEDYYNGMRAMFFAETTNDAGQNVFGNWDMHETLDEDYWHFWTTYPSSKGLSVKTVNEINIYTGGKPAGWELELHGYLDYTMTQPEFEDGIACHGAATYVDSKGREWSGLPLWLLCGWVDDDVQHGEGAFNDDLAADGYDIIVSDVAEPPYSATITSDRVAPKDDSIIVANRLNGDPIPPGDSSYPLKLVGSGLVSGSESVKAVASITLTVPSAPPEWELELHGYLDYTMTQSEFEEGVACHGEATWEDSSGNEWSGLPLWLLCGWVDDEIQHSDGAFNDALAAAGYDIIVSDEDPVDPYSKTITSDRVAPKDDSIIVANRLNGHVIPLSDSSYPLRLVGSGLVSGSERVKAIASITLANLPSLMEFSVDHMFINFTWLRPHTQDTIIANGSFSLPEGAAYDLTSDDVSMDIDGVNIEIPAGSFKKWLPHREIYTYSSPRCSSPSIWMSLNFGTGEWSLLVRDVDASVVDNSDGVDVKLSIGLIKGAEHIGMRVDSLSY
jgi:hypothetical protein